MVIDVQLCKCYDLSSNLQAIDPILSYHDHQNWMTAWIPNDFCHFNVKFQEFRIRFKSIGAVMEVLIYCTHIFTGGDSS